jgi:mannose-6-phosphate isomerase
MNPVVLPPNVVPRFYRGGAAIAELRGVPVDGDRMPEEWIGSTAKVFGEERLGLATLPGGGLLRDAIAADPEAYLGPEHVARYGPDPALLVKLLDAGERLPVHAHPDAAFASANLGIPYGKTEAWIVIAAERGAAVHAGWSEDVERATLERWIAAQDHDALLGALHPVPVSAGDAIFVPAGVPHAIGAGVLIVELQEPTDMSVLLEWDGFGIADEDEATLGLGWERALGCVELAARDAGGLRGPAPDGPVSSLLPAAADRFFRAERVTGGRGAELAQGFAVTIVLAGSGTLRTGLGGALEVGRGAAVLIPWAAGPARLEGDVVALFCRPPTDSLAENPDAEDKSSW